MAVKSSGQLAMTEIVAEFGGDAPHAMSEYYGGGDKVPAGANPNVATSGMTKFGDFYDAVAATVLTISSNTSNYNIKTAAIAAGGDQNTPVILTINNGVTVNSSSNSTPAMKTDTGWGSGTTINITNNGTIIGANGSAGSSGSNSSANPSSGGGTGGNGGGGGCGVSPGSGSAGSAGATGSGSASSSNNGSNGTAGGNAFEHSQTGDNNLSVIFDTAGTRTAGTGGAGGSAGTHSVTGNGGGGGGGGSHEHCYCNTSDNSCNAWDPAGGGGGGAATGSGGTGGSCGAENGSSGSSTSGGQYGRSYRQAAGHNYVCNKGNSGGSGGNLGSAGSAGAGSSFSGGAGGSAGATGNYNGSAGSAGANGSALAGNTGQIS